MVILIMSLVMVLLIIGVDWCSRRPDSSWFNYPKTGTVKILRA